MKMYYETHGCGPPLVLIGGLNSNHTLFRTLLPRLAESYHVIVFDNRGIGQSTGGTTAFTIETLAEDTADLLHALGLAPSHVLGVSLGGRIAAALTLAHPELVRSLVLVSTTMEPPPRTWHQRWVGLLIRLPFIRHGSPYAVVAQQRAASRAFNCMNRLHEIRIPTLIAAGTRDPLVPVHMAEEMHALIPGSSMISFSGGHLFFLMQARQFLDAVLAFLDALGR